jgi:hypothetical protein
MAYRTSGVAGLRLKWNGKNANKLTDEQRLHQYRPVDLHLSKREYWTMNDLRVAIEQWFGVIYQDETSYQRTTKIYRSRPAKRN